MQKAGGGKVLDVCELNENQWAMSMAYPGEKGYQARSERQTWLRSGKAVGQFLKFGYTNSLYSPLQRVNANTAPLKCRLCL